MRFVILLIVFSLALLVNVATSCADVVGAVTYTVGCPNGACPHEVAPVVPRDFDRSIALERKTERTIEGAEPKQRGRTHATRTLRSLKIVHRHRSR